METHMREKLIKNYKEKGLANTITYLENGKVVGLKVIGRTV